jgi:hypothetical protein
MIRGHTDVRRPFFQHLKNRSQDAHHGVERCPLLCMTPAVIVAEQLVGAIDEVNDHVATSTSFLVYANWSCVGGRLGQKRVYAALIDHERSGGQQAA